MRKFCNYHMILVAGYFSFIIISFSLKLSFIKTIDISFLSQNFLTRSWQSATRNLYDIELMWLVVAIFGILSIYHLIQAIRLGRQSSKSNHHPARWLINGLTLGLMLIITASLLGISDAIYLAILAVAMLIFAGLGIVGEYLTAPSNVPTSSSEQQPKIMLQTLPSLVFKLHKIIGVLPWLGVGLSLWASALYSFELLNFSHWSLYFSGLLLMFTFLIVGYFLIERQRRGLASNYVRVEAIYHISLFVGSIGWFWSIANLMN
ncbi:MAG: hypothetical protein OXF85_02000 [Candidatus Saccharibacteria bacterium]|nr:hypothetical protein [Candidatus Saccharibacteria bacterium]